MSDLMIHAEGLVKTYGTTRALDGVDLDVRAGSVLGLLGPNGAGKTTAVKILTTLSVPDSGVARVAGFDVLRHPDLVRRHIGVTAQNATLDELLTGRANLVMTGELSGLSGRAAKEQAARLLEQFSLADAADRVLRGYSGGMRRRLDLAASLMSTPEVLFLDEPTTGLDPVSRQQMWGIIRALVADGVTLLLTTQYLDEADALADRIVVIDHGNVIADGTASELKAATGAARLDVTLTAPQPAAVPALRALIDGPVDVSQDGRRLQAAVPHRPGLATEVVRALDGVGALVDDVAVHQPSLDDVFFALTGSPSAPTPSREADLELQGATS